MKNIIKKYPVVFTIVMILLLFAIATSFCEEMYNLFSFHSKPVYIWQYFSGTFMHGGLEAPKWFLWVHLFLNCLMIIPFGSILENEKGSKYTFVIFIVTLVISSIVFHILTLPYSQDITASGISSIGYAFITGGILNIKKLWKTYSIKIKVFYITLIILSLIMLLPTITGWMATVLHLTGVGSYFITNFFIKSKK